MGQESNPSEDNESELKVDNDGTQLWYKKNTLFLHRRNKPAVIYSNGDKQWFLDGKRHRANSPAIECSNGHREWWYDGKLHRLDGPAVEISNGRVVEYWINNRYFRSQQDWELEVEQLNNQLNDNHLIFNGKKYKLVEVE